jgi:hypothetical protein
MDGSFSTGAPPMSNVESPLHAHRLSREIRPRQAQREIAELLATAIVRARLKRFPLIVPAESEVSLGFTANQRVNANPSYTEGVQE